jgi:hypothetical protein
MKLLLLLSALTVSLSGRSQLATHSLTLEDSSVNFVANWKLNDTKIYTIIHKKNTVDPAGKSDPFSFAYEAWITVLDSTAKNYTIKWIFHLPGDITILRPGLADSLPVYNGLQMIFRTTEAGAFVELLNWEEVRDAYTRMMELSLPKKTDSTSAAILKSAKDMYKSKELVESTMIREIELFHLPYGYIYTTREISAKMQLPNPFGGDPYPALQTYKVTELHPKEDFFVFAADMRVDKANTKSMVDAILNKMNIKDDREMQTTREKYFSFDMHDFSEYTFIKSTGWIKRIYYNRTINMEGTTQTDTYTIKLKD